VNPRRYILALSGGESSIIELSTLTVVGGADCSGKKLKSLKDKSDYAVLSTGARGEILVHSLLGRSKGVRAIENLVPVLISDLTLVCLPEEVATSHLSSGGKPVSDDSLVQALTGLMSVLSTPDDMSSALSQALELIMSRYLFEKGIVVVKKLSGDFEVRVSHGMKPGDPWLSESLVQDTLKLQAPICVRNLMGSQYDSRKSFVAAGFMSVFSWPLIVRGQTLGALIVGSSKPHDGLSNTDMSQAQILVQLVALMLQSHLRELKVREEAQAMRALSRVEDNPFLSQNIKMQDVVRLAEQVSPTDLSVLIQGETGVGKEVLARWIHTKSERSEGPFVAINCGAIPNDLIESVLFGHRKGAFTGAVADMNGKFQLAHGGTIFLDEIGDVSPQMQVKLLRALQEKVIEPLGSGKSIQIDVRVLSASHKSLLGLVQKNQFREDLFYRLAEVTLEIPALRERTVDIPVLAIGFLKEAAPGKRFSQNAWEWLKLQSWKGNVRELKSSIKRVAVLSRSDEISVEDFARGLPGMNSISGSGEKSQSDMSSKPWLGADTLESAKELFVISKVREALVLSAGHRTKAADLLGVTPRTLFRYLDEYAGQLKDVSTKSADEHH
jgi:two-component system, response regulator FlrC